jgi:hypothetical protein
VKWEVEFGKRTDDGEGKKKTLTLSKGREENALFALALGLGGTLIIPRKIYSPFKHLRSSLS